MKWSDSHRTLYNASCGAMTELADNSIQCVVTSPPYWGLRKYKGEQDLIWGGDKECSHEWLVTPPRRSRKASDIVNLESKEATNRGTLGQELTPTDTCSLCGAWRGAYGLEPSPEMYVQHTVEILREIRRVLRKDGVVFWNCGDSYWGGKGQSGQGSPEYQEARQDVSINRPADHIGGKKQTRPSDGKHQTIKPKDLCLIPFRVAIALQEDGWWIRSVIIWNKPNPMPESVTDRPTDSYEYILMLTKSPKYYWDMEAVREPANPDSYRTERPMTTGQAADESGDWHLGGQPRGRTCGVPELGRNLRNVWTFPTQPYREAHFATFPEALPERCIKAATPEAGCCSKCGRAWERIVERKRMNRTELPKGDIRYRPNTYNGAYEDINGKGDAGYTETKTLGWQPGCKCNADKVPSIVLDCFAGSGTTLEVAAKLNRRAVGYEISEEYCNLIIERNRQSVIF